MVCLFHLVWNGGGGTEERSRGDVGCDRYGTGSQSACSSC